MTIAQVQQLLVKILTGLTIAILVVVPFHALLTVWGASLVGHYTGLRLWKEVLLTLAAIIVWILLLSDKDLRQKFTQDWLIRLIGLYALLTVATGAIAYYAGSVSRMAVADGILLNLRFLLFFVVTWTLTRKSSVIYMNWRKLLIGPALAVVGFGLLQRFALPYDFLRHLGYGPATVDPYETIDQKRSFIRFQSTLRGANPLGAYLLVIITALATLVTRVKPFFGKVGWVLVGFAGLIVLFYSYSRSAWLGTLASVGILVALGLRNRPHLWRLSFMAAIAVLLAGSAGLFIMRDNDYVQNTFFHTDEHSRSASSSNAGHLGALRDGLDDVAQQPFGGGTGTAGPASVHNELATPRIAENYFVQIAQETGVIGLALFVTINFVLARRLWQREYDSLARILLSSLVGISLVGLLSHVWTDDTLAYVWWGFAGVAVARLKVRKNETD
jgi:hypothetical protein